MIKKTDLVQLRNANQNDAKVLAYIQTESWKTAFRDILVDEDLIKYTDLEKAEMMYQRVLNDPRIHIVLESVAEKPHCIAAWGQNRANLGEHIAELICIHSLPDQWCRGYGSIMMEYILSEIKAAGYSDVILWVFEENTRARRFYEKHGFVLSTERQNNLGAAEVMYTKKL